MGATPDQIKAEIKHRFVKLALAPQEEQKFPVGPESAKRLGYDGHEIDSLPRSVTESFAGVGDPLALGEPGTGQTVLDLGAGAGLETSRGSWPKRSGFSAPVAASRWRTFCSTTA